MSFGPGDAFGSFASSVARPPRRINSSGSFKDGPDAVKSVNGPNSIDTTANSAWQDLRQRENSSASSASSHAHAGPLSDTALGQQRSFSSILSPPLTGTAQQENRDPLAKPFVYSREFILSLYDGEKASKRPIEMAHHEVATSNKPNKPWILQEYRPGEQDLFATTIHPANNRTRSSHQSHRHTSGGDALSPSTAKDAGVSQTLDLASLGALPRDRDRAAMDINGGTNGSIGRASSLTNGSSVSNATDRSALGALGASRRTRSGLGGAGSGTIGIVGGVLGGIAGPGRLGVKKDDGEALKAGKDAWQGGRWRRGEGDTVDDDKSSFAGARRDAEDLNKQYRASGDTSLEENVPHTWDAEGNAATDSVVQEQSRDSAFTPTQTESYPDLTQHATSILGSLALDSEDDPVVPRASRLSQHQQQTAQQPNLQPQQSSSVPPPGLSKPAESMWQYRDPTGQIQGPFSATMMHDWYRQSFFQMDLRVRRAQELEFETLENLIRRTGDIDSPFLTAPPQVVTALPPPGVASLGGNNWPVASSPLEQLSGTPSSAPRAFDEHRASSASPSPFGSSQPVYAYQTGQEIRRTPSQSAADPWGLPSIGQWDETAFRGALAGGAGLHQQPQQQRQQQDHRQPMYSLPSQQFQAAPNSAADLFRQLTAAQSPSSPLTSDVFGNNAAGVPASAFFEQEQQPVDVWAQAHGQQTPQQAQRQQQQQQQQQTPQQPWSTLIPSRSSTLDVSSPIGTPAISPIGPPQSSRPSSVVPSPIMQKAAPAQQASVEQQSAAAASPWGDVPKVEAADLSSEPAPSASEASPVPLASASEKATPVEQTGPATGPSPTLAAPASAELEQSTTPTPKPAPSVAPWIKEEEKKAAPAGPSLREIQEAEAREVEKRKAAARVKAAQANIQAAQLAAAAEAAEQAQQLPASAGWGAPSGSPAAKPAVNGTAAPWSKPKSAGSGGKTLKEIQEEEEKRKQEQTAALAQAHAQAATASGRPLSQAAPTGGSSWTTIAVRAPPTKATPSGAPRSVIPGLPVSAVSARSAATAAKPVAPAPAIRPAGPAAVSPAATSRATAVSSPAPAVPKPSVIRSVSVGGVNASKPAPQYDAENPPPPSPEFMKWCKDSLKGLTVPMDEFVRMLLSFPLDASSDVLEIISDSVYANSSTLDGRRFANEYTSRRKVDAAARFPQIFKGQQLAGVNGVAAKKVGGANMAEALKSQPVAKTPEWSVKVSGAKKKKGGK